MSDKEPPQFIDRIGVGLIAAISFLFFYGFIYGLVVLNVQGPTESVSNILAFMFRLFLWGTIFFFVIGFVLLINPIEIILNLFDKK